MDVEKFVVKNTEYDVNDPNDVKSDGGDLLDTVINYDSATGSTIGSFTQFLDRFVSGTKVGTWFKNFRAGCEFLLHIGSLVNNCVSDNEALPLAAAQGKVLMDLITDANATIEENKFSADSSIADLQSQVTQINNDLSSLQESTQSCEQNTTPILYTCTPAEDYADGFQINRFYKIGKLCVFYVRFGNYNLNGTSALIATLPDEVLPAYTCYFPVTVTGILGSGNNYVGVTTDRRFQVVATTTGATTFVLSGTYITAS